MPSPEEIAVAGAQEIEQRKQDYASAGIALNASRDAHESIEAQIKLLEELYKAGTAFFYCVERCISNSELLGAHRSDFWATDLAATAVNVLDNVPLFYERVWADADRLKVTRPKPSPNAFYAMQSSVVIYNADQVHVLAERFNHHNLPVRGFTHPTQMNTRYANWEKLVMGSTVVAFLLILLAIGVFMKDYNNFNILVFRTVLALDGAAFGGIFISGLIQVEAKLSKFLISASGATAFFVIIFFCNPPALVRNVVETDKPSAVVAPIER